MNIINNDNNNNLIFIRSNHILKQIMVNLSTNKLLDIIRYNKKLQNNLNKNIDFYKEYTNIEIEIIPKKINPEILLIFQKKINLIAIFILMKKIAKLKGIILHKMIWLKK